MTTASTPNLTNDGVRDYTFSVTYNNSAGINVASLDSNDIRVTGPNGFSQLATLVSIDNSTNGSPRTATYKINPPSTGWNTTNNGLYSVALESNQVSDISGNFGNPGIVSSFLVSIAGTGTGLKGEYYDNIDFTNLKLTRTDATVNFDFGNASPDSSIGVDTFSVLWKGRVEAKYSENYTFYSTTDDGVQVKVNGQVVIDKLIDQPPTTNSGSITLQAGQKYDIEIKYYENTGGAIAQLEWSSSTQAREIISSTQLYLPVTPPTIRLGQVPSNVYEANGMVQVEIQRFGENLDQTSTVKYATTGETATENDDFTAVSGTVTFAPGETTKLVTVPILQDTLIENDETFTFVVDQPTNATLGTQRTARITIDDDDRTDLTFSSPTVNENDGTATVIVKRGKTTAAASVDYTTVNDTAIVNSDYQAVSGTLTFAPGERTKVITIPIINDTVGEPNEKLKLQFSNPLGVGLNPLNNSTEITIVDNDPGSFVREAVLSGLTQPTAFGWSPNGNLLYVAQKDGVVRVANNGSLLATPFIDISDQVNNVRDRGLLGLAVQPNLVNGKLYVYLLFTYDPAEADRTNSTPDVLDNADREGNRPSRLIRVEADPATNFTTAIANSAVVLLGNNSTWANTSRPDGNSTNIVEDANGNINFAANFAPSGIVNQNGKLFTSLEDYYNNLSNITNIEDYLATDSESHSIGNLKFGTDGSLFISNGDGASYNRVDPRAIRVQDLNNLSGKILRIDPLTGLGLADNPFYNASKPNSNISKVYDYGLRNPFRFTIDKTTNTPYIGDVGWKTWEEINTGKGKNFGWPYYEGGSGNSLQQPEYANLAPAQIFYNSRQPVTSSIYAYQHSGSNAIIMGDFYTGNTFPSVYQNTLFITDVSKGTIDSITLNNQGQFVSIRRFDQFTNPQFNAAVQITTGNDGNLYYADLAAGTISRWRAVVPT
jgi:glucose/arabinose dehydrogenase